MASVGFMEALDGWPLPVRFFSDASFLIERLMLLAEAPCAYSIAVLSRIVLWQYVGDLRPLGGSSNEKWPACAGARMREAELICPTSSH